MKIPNWMSFPGAMFLVVLLLLGLPFMFGPAVWIIGPLWWGFWLFRLIRRARKMRA